MSGLGFWRRRNHTCSGFFDNACYVFDIMISMACVFITAVPITKLFASRWGRGIVEDSDTGMCYERRRAEA